MQIQCPKCGQDYEVEEQYAGQQVQCQCGAAMEVPKIQPPEKTKSTSVISANLAGLKAAAKSFSAKAPEPVKSIYLPGFEPPFAAKVFNCLMLLVIIITGVAFIAGIATQQPPVAVISVLGGACVVFSLYVSKLVITCLAEIAFNTRQIAKNNK